MSSTMSLILSFCALANANNIERNPLYVDTIYGTIQGYCDDYANIWSSIPFAAPPIGDFRFAAPQPHTTWEGVLSTRDDAPGCIQSCSLGWWACPRRVDEDCLYLNVLTPRDASPTNLKSVLFFLHGGDFYQGYSGGLLYNASVLVNLTDIVLVTTNYRLGAQGFFYDHVTGLMGNYGFQDQQFAMEWVYKNIERFGGNKSDVSIFGQSAGAVSTILHLLNTNNTFKAAIMESNPFGQPMRTPKTWGQLPNLFKIYAGCNPIRSASEQLQCLRKISATDLLKAQIKAQKELAVEARWFADLFMPWTPTVGTGLIKDQPLFAIQKCEFLRDIPIIAGTNKDEGTLFLYRAFPNAISKLEYEALLALVFNNVHTASAIIQYYSSYNITNQSDYRGLMAEITTDAFFRCPTHNVSNVIALDKSYKSLNYMYHFNHISSFNHEAFPNDPHCWNSVCHGVELPYVFEPDMSIANTSYTPSEWQLAQTVGYYWSSLAKYKIAGNGNPKRPVQWLPFGGGAKQNSLMFNVQNVNNGTRIESNYDLPVCDFWDTLSYNWVPN